METMADDSSANAGHEERAKRLYAEAPIVLEPSGGSIWNSLGEIWAYRELMYFLMWRDLKVRYKQTMLGAAWVIMQPLVMTLVFTVFLGKLARVPSVNTPYSLMVFSGLIPWMFFSSALIGGGTSLVANAHLITKVYFPRLIVPLAAVGARLVDLAISLIVLAGLMYYYRVNLSWKLAALPLLILVLTSFALAVGTLASAWNVKYRDVGIMLPVLVQLWMFASPIVYPVEIVPERWRQLYMLNPMVGIISGFRSLLLNLELDWTALLVSVAMGAVLLAYAMFEFRRLEKDFADEV